MDAGRIRGLFLRALEAGAGERESFLERACESEEEREAVAGLLAYDTGGQTDALLEAPIAEIRRQAVSGRFGAYEIQAPIRRGGMGAVYKAARADGEVRQVVAIKILDREWLDPETVGRFRRERQILSGLAHPNIARLLDTGTREDGRPYLVMEYIEGEPLDEYCRSRNSGIREKLRLFLPVCRAVEHAHSKLVIHRDLKPSNILVTAEGEPKLLDFGIARALDEMDARTTATLVLTPDYASPDQARGEPPSTATDVYGLGAVLYFLLTGSAPHRVEGLPALEAVRRLCETEPAPPSSLRPELKGDLENILRKAMHIDPERRYGSARELAEDVENYLATRPVRATPDSLWYRAGRFAVRRRWLVTAAAAVLLALAAGGTYAWRERLRADEEAAIARAVNEFLQNDLLSQAGARSQAERGVNADPDLKVRTVLDRAARAVAEKFGRLPKVEASLRTVIGSAYADQGLDVEARKHYTRALDIYRTLDPRSPKSLEAVNRLAELHAKLGQRSDAEALFRRNLELPRWAGREQKLAAAQARFGLATLRKNQGSPVEALPLMKQAFGEMRALLGPEHEKTLAVAVELAVLYNNGGRREAAAGLLQEVLEIRQRTLGEAHPETLYTMSELGVLHRLHGRREEAEVLLRRAAQGFEATLGPGHPNTLAALNNLAIAFSYWGRYPLSTAIYERVLATERKLRGPDHPDSLVVANNLAVQYLRNGKYALAAKLHEETLAANRKQFGAGHPATLLVMRNLGADYREMGRPRESARLIGEALEATERQLGTHPDTARILHEMGRTQKALGNYSEAERLFQRALAIRTKLGRAGSQSTLSTMTDLAGLYAAMRRSGGAEKLYQETLSECRKTLGGDHPDTLNAMSGLADLYRNQGRLGEAAALAKPVVEASRQQLGDDHPATLRAMRDLAAIYRRQGRFSEARTLAESVLRAVAARERQGEPVPGMAHRELKLEMAGLSTPAAP